MQFNVKNNGKLGLMSSFETPILGESISIRSCCFFLIRGCFYPILRNLFYIFVTSIGSDHQSINLPFNPDCIAQYDSSNVIVSEQYGNSIKFVDMSKMKLAHKILLTRVNLRGGSYCMSALKGNIWVGLNDCSILVLNKEGKKSNTSFTPWEISLTEDGYICCLSRDDEKVRTLSTEGTATVIYSGKDLRTPWGITADNGRHVFVSGFCSNNVHRISRDGKRHKAVLDGNENVDTPKGYHLILNGNFS